MMLKAAGLNGVLIAALAWGSPQTATPDFEAVSFKQVSMSDARQLPAAVLAGLPGDGFHIEGGPDTNDPARIRISGATLRELLSYALNTRNAQITGPSWISTEHYSLEATLPAGVTRAQVRQMLEKLLADRLQIEMHHEQRAMSVYLLEVAKGGPKLQPPAPTPHSESDAESRADQQKRALEGLQKILAAREANAAGIGERQPSRGFHLAHASMQLLAQFLSFNLDRPVIDKTGLDGEFSCQLRWDPDRTGATSEPGSGLSIFTAIQEQLGLKLEALKETADFVVIDKANRTPPEN